MGRITPTPPLILTTRSAGLPMGATNWPSSSLAIRDRPLDNSQRKAALEVIHEAKRPLLFVYIHGWQNNATSADVCRFEHFLDTVSGFPEFTGRKINVIGVYIAWRGKDLTLPGLNFLTFWSRKSTGGMGLPLRTAAWQALKNSPSPPTNPAKITITPSYSGIPSALWCLGTRFLIPSSAPMAKAGVVPAPGTWPWRLTRPIVPSLPDS